MHYAKVYMCLEHNVFHMLITLQNMQIYSTPSFVKKLFAWLHFTLVELSNQFNAE